VKKMMVAAALAVAMGVAAAAPASAASGFTGFVGLTHLGYDAELSASGQADGTGSGTFSYSPEINGQTVTIICNDFRKYVSTHTNNPPPNGYPKTILNATNCIGSDVRYFVHIEAIDRVGIGKKIEDSLCIVVKLFPGRQHPDPLIKDCGAPVRGDVVINQ
jgi:opacity protein-like surface antigen